MAVRGIKKRNSQAVRARGNKRRENQRTKSALTSSTRRNVKLKNSNRQPYETQTQIRINSDRIG